MILSANLGVFLGVGFVFLYTTFIMLKKFLSISHLLIVDPPLSKWIFPMLLLHLLKQLDCFLFYFVVMVN